MLLIYCRAEGKSASAVMHSAKSIAIIIIFIVKASRSWVKEDKLMYSSENLL